MGSTRPWKWSFVFFFFFSVKNEISGAPILGSASNKIKPLDTTGNTLYNNNKKLRHAAAKAPNINARY